MIVATQVDTALERRVRRSSELACLDLDEITFEKSQTVLLCDRGNILASSGSRLR